MGWKYKVGSHIQIIPSTSLSLPSLLPEHLTDFIQTVGKRQDEVKAAGDDKEARTSVYKTFDKLVETVMDGSPKRAPLEQRLRAVDARIGERLVPHIAIMLPAKAKFNQGIESERNATQLTSSSKPSFTLLSLDHHHNRQRRLRCCGPPWAVL